MNASFGSALFALAAIVGLVAEDALAQQRATTESEALQADPARPTDSTENLPSATGAQATTPAGAVTGAGQPQGTVLKELDYGAPGSSSEQGNGPLAQLILPALERPAVTRPEVRKLLQANRNASPGEAMRRAGKNGARVTTEIHHRRLPAPRSLETNAGAVGPLLLVRGHGRRWHATRAAG